MGWLRQLRWDWWGERWVGNEGVYNLGAWWS